MEAHGIASSGSAVPSCHAATVIRGIGEVPEHATAIYDFLVDVTVRSLGVMQSCDTLSSGAEQPIFGDASPDPDPDPDPELTR